MRISPLRVFSDRTFSSAFSALCVLSLATAVACSSSDDPEPGVDASVGGQGGTTDGGTAGTGGETPPPPDAGADASEELPDALPDSGETDDAGTGGTGGEAPPPPPPNQMAAAVRFNANGTLDTTFGTNGVTKLDRHPGGTAIGWDVRRDAQNRLYVFGTETTTASGRSDTDRYVARLTADGVLDTTYGETVEAMKTGYQTLNIGNLSDNVRGGLVDSQNRAVTFGYTSVPTGVGTMATNSMIIARLTTEGGYDSTFAVNGVFNYNPFSKPYPQQWGMGESYGGAEQLEGANAGKYVTCGYGRSASSGQVNVVAFRLTATGAFDTSWGDNGIVELDREGKYDASGSTAGTNDRCRNLVRLPGDKILIVGSYENTLAENTPANINPMALVLTANGALDTSFGGAGDSPDGYKLYRDAADRLDDAFFGAAVSPNNNWAAAVGYTAGGLASNPSDVPNQDSRILLLPLSSGTEVHKVVPISSTSNDRFWAAAFGPDNKLYAAGFVAEAAGGSADTAFMVARFNTDGNLDTTFGDGGVAKHNIAVDKDSAETARGVVVQSDGKVVLVGNVTE